MSDEQKTEQSDNPEQGADEDKPSPQERLEDVGANTGTYDLPGPGEDDQRESGTAGLPDEDEVPDETIEEIDSDRAERLDPDNRPDGAEVDNTPRTFDSGAGMFTDNPDYDKNDRPYAGEEDSGPPEEKPSNEDSGADSSEDSGQDAGTTEAEEQESTEQASSDDEPARSAES